MTVKGVFSSCETSLLNLSNLSTPSLSLFVMVLKESISAFISSSSLGRMMILFISFRLISCVTSVNCCMGSKILSAIFEAKTSNSNNNIGTKTKSVSSKPSILLSICSSYTSTTYFSPLSRYKRFTKSLSEPS